MRTIRKLLIANRGEIAIRVMRTCAKMGIATVAVFSDADERALFVREADEAFRLGPAPSRESYLRVDRILAAARATGADAIHPGFGFLAENAEFAQAVRDAGLIFVGPTPAAIRAMGLKREAKVTAQRAGVPVVPGYGGAEQSTDAIAREAKSIGYPLLLKASAGGGGKGMRVVRSDAALIDAIESARREAESSFGDGTLIVEKYVEQPRHVEIQVLGDEHGNLVHLFERECSIQRRHQKVVEEAPSPVLTPEVRARMGADAVKLCGAIGYSNAGTVEFVLDPKGHYYFLEVNTRLQVEHPVTEGVIEGLDLVEEQIRVARGERLRFTQDDLASRWRGASIEVRLCAEDPASGFLPQTGPVLEFHVPAELLAQDWLRIESSVESGDEVPVHYDSMIAKIITKGPTRADAIQRLRRALSALSVQGLVTNRAFLLRVIDHPDFHAGDFDTHFIETRMQGALADTIEPARARIAALAATFFAQHTRAASRTILPSLPITGFRLSRLHGERVAHDIEGVGTVHVEYVDRGGGAFDVKVTGDAGALDGRVRRSVDGPEIALELPDGHRVRARVIEHDERWYVHADGVSIVVREQPRFRDRDADAAADGCVAPMPGKILQVLVSEGQHVAAGDTIVVMEAMKMEHAVKAPHEGVITELRARVGDQVEGGVLIAVVSENGGSG
ncbi:acetyl/propionyl/methylcrotonyl-CoA carboxylase subunit alpha [Sandaracinus amylolyticus]|uniref:Methylcrotonyl-CoA carboxylase biotin-containing subunit n=1 Tax=Sandaracinus amylolyticus TaxID=927083 RepID=A0A0F6W119_9BACT|nr:acetyl-CoA carboxylase biotin carboxylase subunit [Sandaracinus amylolyticus]AKF04705.1 Methylcrotonyl-CoA carboxylase biotin-containing subunit [Sandaracinus amylolyticus]